MQFALSERTVSSPKGTSLLIRTGAILWPAVHFRIIPPTIMELPGSAPVRKNGHVHVNVWCGRLLEMMAILGQRLEGQRSFVPAFSSQEGGAKAPSEPSKTTTLTPKGSWQSRLVKTIYRKTTRRRKKPLGSWPRA